MSALGKSRDAKIRAANRKAKELEKELTELGVIYRDKAKKAKDNPFFTTLLGIVVPKVIKLAGMYFAGKAAYKLADKTVDAVTSKVSKAITDKVT